ncbi:alpha/beta hydrolase family protein [Microbacterium invictum]|uniref:Pimeloyl-ACP methyl ester carboxylesterase n=1 Tax=Microbacterium invictum TaxID=515415 RepID=A0AA40VMB1_9MICO|nr:alpha/beta fold hydrolase [Microbacterium invictum]MBB4139143.1 pimeloyl-ACP methyl ester carboxylesterase [Microbacterium invictum]
MLGLRRAGPVGAAPALISGLRAVLMILASALVAVLGLTSFMAVKMARRVVTPGGRVPDTRILDVDTAAQTITLSRTPDTVLPGRYGLFTVGTSAYLKLGSVLSEDASGVKRKLLTHVATDAHLAPEAAFSGWYFDSPDDLRLPYTTELVGASVGPCPAWLFPADDEQAGTWVIQIHGRGTTRAECLRAVPVFHAAGITSLVVSYRNDGEAPRSRSGTYALGATEWHDVEPALAFARRRGARRIILMGWSMGGAIALQLALHSGHRDLLAGVVLESPVVDWRRVLDHQARLLGLPSRLADLTVGTLQREWSAGLSGADAAIPFDQLDIVARAAELRHPILILHSDDDGFVPSSASHDLAQARPDLVELHVFDVARHTKLWNYDQQRWTQAITAWLERTELTAPAV